jgi:hypothetical protein
MSEAQEKEERPAFKTEKDVLISIDGLLADVTMQLERIADCLEAAMPRDRDGDRRLRTKNWGAP